VLAGDVVVVGGNRAILAFDARTGAARWRHALPGVSLLSLSGDARGVYARVDNATSLLVLDARTGRTRWARALAAPAHAFPLAGHDIVSVDGVVAVSELTTRRLYGLDAASGADRWEAGVSELGMSGLLEAGRGLLLGRDGADLVAFDAATGDERWRAGGAFGMAIAGDLLIVGGGDGVVTARDVGTGSVRWQQRVERPAYSYSLGAGDALAVVATFDHVLAFDALTGRRLWSRRLTGSPPNKKYSVAGELGEPRVVGGTVVVTAGAPQRPDD
jgi:outer membrane protein assembly factor BamB